ncbi:hydrolase 1, exosortase A system-associated [Pacificimonas sp. ICDLI1SI03]
MTPIDFPCAGETLFGTLHEGVHSNGLIIVTGGTQVRAGPQRLFARLGQDLSASGFPVLRFDRRGVGDSGGGDPGFLASSQDIEAAATALRQRQPSVSRIFGLGLCDGATALTLSPGPVAELILLNPWIIDEEGPPPAAAVTAHYRRRLLQPAAWRRIITGRANPLAALKGLFNAAAPSSAGDLELRVVAALSAHATPAYLLLSSRDRTADVFRPVAKRLSARFATINQIEADHAFSHPDSYAALLSAVANILFDVGRD